MTIDPDALYLLERSGTCYKVKSSDLPSVGQAGDLLFCNKAEDQKSYKVEFSRWNDIPNDALMLVNLNDQSYSVTGNQFKTNTLDGLPSGPRIIQFENVNGVGSPEFMANDNLGNYGGAVRSTPETTARIRCYLTINGIKYKWKKNTTFSFYTTTPNSGGATVNGETAGVVSPDSWNSTSVEWQNLFTLSNDSLYIEFNLDGNVDRANEIRIHSTRVNGETAINSTLSNYD